MALLVMLVIFAVVISTMVITTMVITTMIIRFVPTARLLFPVLGGTLAVLL